MIKPASSSPPPSPGRGLRVLALTPADAPVPRAFAHLVSALRDQGAQVTPLPVPRRPPRRDDQAGPRVADLKAGLQQLISEAAGALANLSGAAEPAPPADSSWLVDALRRGGDGAPGDAKVQAVVAVDAALAARAFPVTPRLWPDAVRVGVAPSYHLAPTWDRAPLDDLVVAHPALLGQLATLREGRARPRTGGPLVGGEGVAPRRLQDDRPLVVASCARMGPGDVDPFLLQLSLAHPERFDLLFLPAGRPGVDELVRTRAGGYGLRGKRPREGADPEPWIRGAAVLAGRPSPEECAAAVEAGVPALLFAPGALEAGEQLLVDQGAAARAEVPLTVAVQLEGLLPGGEERHAAEEAARALAGGGAGAAARAVLTAAREGRPQPGDLGATAAPASPTGERDDELEDIGGAPEAPETPLPMPTPLRRAYLREIILQQKGVERQLARARAGHDTWSRRVRLAQTAGDPALARAAAERVSGLSRIIDRLASQQAQLVGLRDRFAGRGPLTAADRAQAARFMSPSVAATLDRARPEDESAFQDLELDDRLAALKRKLTPS